MQIFKNNLFLMLKKKEIQKLSRKIAGIILLVNLNTNNYKQKELEKLVFSYINTNNFKSVRLISVISKSIIA